MTEKTPKTETMKQNDVTSSRDFRAIRVNKIKKLQELNIHPYPDRFEVSHTLDKAPSLPIGENGVKIAGRITAIRAMGNLTFGTLSDISGKFQIALQKKIIGAESYNMFKKCVDIGDFIGAEGETMETKTGEKTLNCQTITFLGKSLLPLPEKFHGITDVEKCYRQRYLDLIMNDTTKTRFLMRSKVISTIRRFLEDHSFIEVETPVLCNKASGALAKPFVTHHNALGIDVFLRIAPETYLKRCVVGGFNRVFEFSRCFRNEGISPMHLQDFTMLEYYAAYWNFRDNMRFSEKLIQNLLSQVFDSLLVRVGEKTVDFSGFWPEKSFGDLILADCGIDITKASSADALRATIKSKNIHIDEIDTLGMGNLVDSLYKKVSRPKLIDPIFVTGHPVELSPLARKSDTNPALTDRFQLVVAGAEIINAYSELVDPIDQRQRLEDQASAKAGGDAEAMEMDDDYIRAMEYGMPPISGWGLGIDRLVALLSGCDNIRDVVLFPLNRPESQSD